jgi:hypothetical protein
VRGVGRAFFVVSGPSVRALPARIRPVVSIVLFLAGFTAANLAVETVAPSQLDFFARTKLDQLQTAVPPYDLVFLGPSTTYNHINAELFERRLRESGHAVHAFNLGTPAMNLCEADMIVRRVLTTENLGLRWVLLDLDLANSMHMQEPFSRRYIAWHDLPGAWCDLKMTLPAARTVTEQVTHVYDSVKAVVYHVTNAGALAQILGDRVMPPARAEEERRYLARGRQGFLAIDDGLPYRPGRNQKYLLGLEQYRRDRNRPGLISEADARRTANGVDYLNRMVGRLDARSVQSVFFLSPDLSRDDAYLDAVVRQTGRPVFAFNDIDAYPDLYQVDLRFGQRHLNGAGADRLTGLLAEQFARRLDQTGR